MDQERVKAILTIVVTAVVNIANILGYAWNMDAVLNGVLTVFSFVCILWSWWKNQNITDEAIEAQAYLNGLKAAKHSEEG